MTLPTVRRSIRKKVKQLLRDRLLGRYFPTDHDFSDGPPVRITYGNASLPSAARNAAMDSATDYVWDRLESAGLVRVEYPYDESSDYADLAGDTYNVELNEDTVPGGARTIIAQGKAYKRKIESDGVVGMVTSYRVSTESAWENGDAIWGFVGVADAETSGYLEDCKSLTIAALREALTDRCPTCRQAKHN